MMEYMCFSFLSFGSGSDISVSSLQDFLLRINDQDCFGFEDVFFFLKMRTLLSYRCTREVRDWKNDELKGKNKENGGSSFSGLSFRVLGFGSSFSGL